MVDIPELKHERSKELELKYIVNHWDDLETIAAALAATHKKTARQVNTFFDTADFYLNNYKYSIRLRKEEGTHMLTAKSPALEALGGVMTEREEQEVRIEQHLARNILEGNLDPLDVLFKKNQRAEPLVTQIRQFIAGKRLVKAGAFLNFRETFLIQFDHVGEQEIEMDTVIFPGNVVQFEIEIEISPEKNNNASAISKAMDDVFNRTGISPRSGPSKAKRFFNAIQGKSIK